MKNYNLLNYRDKFPQECSHLLSWNNLFQEQLIQFQTFYSIIKEEENKINEENSFLNQSTMAFTEKCQPYSEPSNIFYLVQSFISCYNENSKNKQNSLNDIDNSFVSVIPEIIQGIREIIFNLIRTNCQTMEEVKNIFEQSQQQKKTYDKLKSELDESQLKKKKYDTKAQYAYNIVKKDRADQKLSEKIKQMEELIPIIQNLENELNLKQEKFNSTMKENFELVITNLFKNLTNLHQCFFVFASKKKELFVNISKLLKSNIKTYFELVHNITDLAERKFSEQNGIKYESINNFDLKDTNLLCNSSQLEYICYCYENYIHTFLICANSRRKLIKYFSNLIENVSKFGIKYKENCFKAKAKLVENLMKTKFFGSGTRKSWNLFSDLFLNTDPYFFEYQTFEKQIKEFNSMLKNSINDFNSHWEVLEKKIEEHKLKVINERKLMDESKIKANKSGKTFNSEEYSNKISRESQRLIYHLTKAHNYIKDNVNVLREKEITCFNRIKEKCYSEMTFTEGSVKKYIDICEKLIDNSTSLDIFEEWREMCKNSLDKQGMTGYETLFEKIKMKIFLKSDFTNDKLGQSTVDMLNELNIYEGNNLGLIGNNYSDDLSFNDEISSLGNKNIKVEEIEINKDEKIKKFQTNELKESQTSNEQSKESNKEMNKEINKDSNKDNINKEEQNPLRESINENTKNPEALRAPPRRRMTRNSLKFDNIRSKTVKFLEDSNEGSSKINEEGESEKNKNSEDLLSILRLEDDEFNFVKENKFSLIEKNDPYLTTGMNDLDKLKGVERKQSQGQYEINFEEGEKLINTFSCAFKESILLQGKLHVTAKNIYFKSPFKSGTLFGKGGTILQIPFSEIKEITKKSNLKIFPNSIQIITCKGKLTFTSFLARDKCFDLINETLNKYKQNEPNEENQKEGEAEANQGNNKNKSGRKKLKISKRINNILTETDFYAAIDKIHNERMEAIIKEYRKNEFFLDSSEFKYTYIEEKFKKTPPCVIFNSVFNASSEIEELGKTKCFYESLFILRNDYDISLTKDTEESNIPLYFSDYEYFISKFANIDKDELSSFLDDVSKWNYRYKFSIRLIHPIAKKIFMGPEKVGLNEIYIAYFISPKCFIVEELSYGFDFPFADTFVNVTQYEFLTDIKLINSKAMLQFDTKCTIRHLVKFIKSAMMKGAIESNGYDQAEEGIKCNTYEKMMMVIVPQGKIFNEMFEKIAEEDIQRTYILNKDELGDDDIEEEIENEEGKENEE
ncbi:MAG: GRAM domain-containing protein, partial [archaeon]|nr:GRAM domain-containing protein [archaeon]